MKLVWHIFRKDLRRLAGPLALWVLLLAAKYAWGWRLITWEGVEPGRFYRMIGVEYLLMWLEVIANFLLVTRLVHADPLVSERAFWITRPIGGARLLAAKLLGLVAMFGVLPLLVAVPWWLANRYDGSLMFEAAFELLGMQLLLVLSALLLAVLTDGLSRLLLWLLVLAAVAVWWFVVGLAGDPWHSPTLAGVMLTRTCVVLATFAAVIATVVTLQFLTRRLVRSLIVTGAGVVVIGSIMWLWPWNWAPAWRQEFSGGPSIRVDNKAASGVTFAVARVRVPDITARTPDYVKPNVQITLAARGVPADSILIYGPTRHTWSWSDGTSAGANAWSTGPWFGLATSPALRRALGLPPWKGPADVNRRGLEAWDDADLREHSATTTRSIAARIHRETPAYTAQINFLLARVQDVSELPLTAGGRHWHDATSLRVIRARQTDTREVSVVETTPIFVRLALTLSKFYPARGERAPREYFLVNRARGTVAGRAGTWDNGDITVASVQIAWRNLRFFNEAGGPLNSDQWLREDTRLVDIAYRDFRYFYQELKVDRFEVTP